MIPTIIEQLQCTQREFSFRIYPENHDKQHSISYSHNFMWFFDLLISTIKLINFTKIYNKISIILKYAKQFMILYYFK